MVPGGGAQQPDTHADSCSHSDADARANSDSDSGPHADTHSRTDADPHTGSDADADEHWIDAVWRRRPDASGRD
jgi:hypothetical protein